MIVVDSPNGRGRSWRIAFDSLHEVQDWLRSTPRTWSISSSTNSGHGSSWDLNVGWQGALDLARDGWVEGVKDITNLLALRPAMADSDPKWRYDVAGERPDIGRFLSGDPTHMMRHGHPKGHRPIVVLAIGANACGGVSATQMSNYGAAMVAVIDQMESTGRRVEAYATFVSTIGYKGDRICPSWKIKNAEDPLDLAALAFSLSHPAAFRRFGFAIYERSAFPTQHGYGASVSSVRDDLIDPTDNTLVISGLSGDGSRCNTLESAIKYAAEQINKAAGEELVIMKEAV